MVAKKRGNARKTPEIVRFRGVEAMISFLASLYGCGTRIRTLVMTESESVALPLGDAALLTNAPHYSRFPRACQELLKKITEFSVNYRNFHHLWELVVAEMPGHGLKSPRPFCVSRIGAEKRRRSRADSSFRRLDGVLIWQYFHLCNRRHNRHRSRQSLPSLSHTIVP